MSNMRNVLIIVVLCLLAGQVACSRKNNSTTVEGNAQANSTADAGAQARTHLENGIQLYRDDQDEKAIEAFQEAIKLDNDLAEAHFRLGLAYEALGKAVEAEESYKKAVQAYKKFFSVPENEKDAEAHYNLAQTYAGLRLYSEAVREYRQATKLKDDDADMYYDMGLALVRLAQYDEAAAAFSKSLEIDPENYRAEDELEEAREGAKRIKAGKKHQEDLLKKKKEEELKKEQEGGTPNNNSRPAPTRKPQA
jgi:tetratricopeptide (TPR) repeat protein